MNDLSHLSKEATKEEGVQQTDSLLHITALADEWLTKKEAFEALEKQAKEAKKEFNKVSQENIPNAMMEVGLSSIKLTTGQTVSFKEDVSCSIKDYSKLDEFLSKRGEDGMMKITLEIGKVPKPILQMMLKDLYEKYEVQAVPKQFVHPATMAAYVRRLCGINGVTEPEMSVAELDEAMVSVYRFYKTTIK